MEPKQVNYKLELVNSAAIDPSLDKNIEFEQYTGIYNWLIKKNDGIIYVSSYFYMVLLKLLSQDHVQIIDYDDFSNFSNSIIQKGFSVPFKYTLNIITNHQDEHTTSIIIKGGVDNMNEDIALRGIVRIVQLGEKIFMTIPAIQRKNIDKYVHDIRNQLMTISALTSSIESSANNQEMHGFLKCIKDSVKDCNYLLSEICSNHIHYKPNFVNIHEILKKNVMGFTSENVKLKCSFDAQNHKIIGKKTPLSNMILNILINAKQALDDGGMITVKTYNSDTNLKYEKANKQWLFIEITDTGCGMDEQVLGNIFEEKFTTKKHGKGLGLSTCLDTINDHDGTIEVTSEVGSGSTFRIGLSIKSEIY